MKKLFVVGVIGLVFFSFLVSAFDIGVNPDSIKLQTQPEKKVCANITLNSEQATIVMINDKWGRSKSSLVGEYGMTGEEFAISTFIPEKAIVGAKEEKEVEFCFTPGGEGTFYGVVIFESFNKKATNKVFLELKSSYQASTGEVNLIGTEHRDIKPVSTKQTIVAFSILNTIFLICVLVYLLRIISKDKKTEKSKKK